MRARDPAGPLRCRRGCGVVLRVSCHTRAGDPAGANEDRVFVAPGLVVVLDGATARTGTGCTHGVAWYADRLGTALITSVADRTRALPDALATAIGAVSREHRGTCDLRHPGTPSAAVAVVRVDGDRAGYLVLGDVSVVLETGDPPGGVRVVVDRRVDGTARAERDEVARHRPGTPLRQAALVRMKRAELAARNRPGGYWIAAADPAAAQHALVGGCPLAEAAPDPPLRRAAVLTDGAARLVDPFGLVDWYGLLDLLDAAGPSGLVSRVRAAEAGDAGCRRWPRNKCHDDATAVSIRPAISRDAP